MGKRVYEIARELDLSTKEVLGRLNEAGMEVKSSLASVEDPLYERVFGDTSDDDAPNGAPKSQELALLPGSYELETRPSRTRWILAYLLVAILGFAVAVSMGAIAAMVLGSDFGFSASERPRASEAQGNAEHEDKQVNAQQEEERGEPQQEKARGNVQQSESDYASEIGKLQGGAVKVFLDSHDRLLHYDALAADDVEKMQDNEATLQEFTDKIDALNPPQKYEEQYKAFSRAVDGLHEATQLAYALAADPITATQSGFHAYDRRVNRAAAYLEKSNEVLGRDYKTIEGVQAISPS